MSELETVKIKSGDADYAIINKSDFDENKHKLFHEKGEGEATDGLDAQGKNPSGTYSEPTPTNIQFSDMDRTEFENNHGAFTGQSAAEKREAEGLPDAPGGLEPIPADWEELHWKTRVNIAEKISGREDLKTDEANDIIAAEVKRRAE